MCIWLDLMVQCTSGSFGVAGLEDGSDSEGSYSEILTEATKITQYVEINKMCFVFIPYGEILHLLKE